MQLEIHSELTVPARYEVCYHCQGRGTSSAYLGAFTESDRDEWGPEFMDDYFRGDFDRSCEVCNGRTTILVPDPDRMTPAQAAEVDAWERAEAEYAAERAMEMRMGC